MKNILLHISAFMLLALLFGQQAKAASVQELEMQSADAQVSVAYDVIPATGNSFVPEEAEDSTLPLLEGEPRRVGQPLPGVMLSVLLAGAVFRIISSLHRKCARQLEELCARIRNYEIISIIHKEAVSLTSNYACCQSWRHVVLLM